MEVQLPKKHGRGGQSALRFARIREEKRHNGLNQAITMGAESMGSVRFVQEKKVVGKFFEQIALDTGLYVFGVQDTLKALELGALELMLLWEDLAYIRYEFKNPRDADKTIVHVLTEAQE